MIRTAVVIATLCICMLDRSSRFAMAAEPANPDQAGVEFFEKNIRPILVERCQACHSSESAKPKGGLLLDSKQGVLQGGRGGKVVVPGQPDASRLIEAVRWHDSDLRMPPKQKLVDRQIELLEQWVRMGVPDPRNQPTTQPKAAGPVAMTLEAGRNWWAFVPLSQHAAPTSGDGKWARTRIDPFIAEKLAAKGLAPSPEADARTLIQRAALDLTGLRASYQDVENFAKDPSDAAYSQLIDQLLASPHYGERWGRYWLDVARYGEDNPTTEATNPPYPFAWRYRDWVIKAMNADMPYDRFVKLQLAADLVPDAARQDLAALGFLGAAPVYHKDGRLSKEVISTLYADDWDERVDTVSRGVLGLSVACARCHDHKFDPISSKDYYSLASIFASSTATPRPLADIDPAAERDFVLGAQRLFYLSYTANLLRTEPGSKPKEAREKVERFVAEMDQRLEELAYLEDAQPELYRYLLRLAKYPDPYDKSKSRASDQGKRGQAPPQNSQRGGRRGGSDEPFVQAVYEAGVWVDGSDADLTMIDVRAGEPHDLDVLRGGNVAKPAGPAPRGFLNVLSKSDTAFHAGSGRLELADRIFTDAQPLAARVIVNRVWAWHFGKPLVATPSDFGAQGEKPSHPELLDDLAARFVSNGWSLKWLHREIMLSAAYRQASRPNEAGERLDPTNRLLWRMNPRRLDVEAFRDCILQAAGTLDLDMFGVSSDLDQPRNLRRTIYGRVSRGRVNRLLQLFDFPEATMHSPGRETTTTPLQQLFVMNSQFMQDQAKALVQRVADQHEPLEKVRAMQRYVLSREPSQSELDLAAEFLREGTLEQYAQALLCSNEVIFWP